MLDQLAGIQGTRYADEATFLQAVKDAVGGEVTQQYQGLLLKYTRYRKRSRHSKVAEIEIDREEMCPVDTAAS